MRRGRGEFGAEGLGQLCLFLWRDKSGFYSIAQHLIDAAFLHTDFFDCGGIFIRKRGIAHARIVGVERDAHLQIVQVGKRMLRQGGNRAGVDVARRADFQRDLPIVKHPYNVGILDRADAVPDALCIQILHGGVDAVTACPFPSVDSDV